MSVANINTQSKVKAADLPLDKLASSKALTEEQKTSEMSRQFEAMLLRQVLSDAQKPMFKSKNNQGVSNAIYQDMMVNQLADKISSSRSLGLSDELTKEFTRQNGKVAMNSKDHAKVAGVTHAHVTHTTHAAQTISQSKPIYQPPLRLSKAPR